ncbi:hypothetical protein NGI46_27650 [Peribacillus butanolivorans]|nr:hypothetical protein [Peribacillus butanolivorans]
MIHKRTIDKHGQILLILDIEFESHWTTLTLEDVQERLMGNSYHSPLLLQHFGG